MLGLGIVFGLAIGGFLGLLFRNWGVFFTSIVISCIIFKLLDSQTERDDQIRREKQHDVANKILNYEIENRGTVYEQHPNAPAPTGNYYERGGLKRPPGLYLKTNLYNSYEQYWMCSNVDNPNVCQYCIHREIRGKKINGNVKLTYGPPLCGGGACTRKDTSDD